MKYSKDKIEVNYMNKVDVVYRDFGNFKGDQKLMVDRQLWTEYIQARKNFEILHAKLEKMIKK